MLLHNKIINKASYMDGENEANGFPRVSVVWQMIDDGVTQLLLLLHAQEYYTRNSDNNINQRVTQTR